MLGKSTKIRFARAKPERKERSFSTQLISQEKVLPWRLTALRETDLSGFSAQRLLEVFTESRISWGREGTNLPMHAYRSNSHFVFLSGCFLSFFSHSFLCYFSVSLFKFLFLSRSSRHCSVCVSPSHHQTRKCILFASLWWHPFLPRSGLFLSLYPSWHTPNGSNSACLFWVVRHPNRTPPRKSLSRNHKNRFFPSPHH